MRRYYARQEATIACVEPMNGLTGVAKTLTELGLTSGVLGTELCVGYRGRSQCAGPGDDDQAGGHHRRAPGWLRIVDGRAA